MSEVRLLRCEDIPGVMRLNQAAGWNQLPEDWARLLDLEPEGCFALECDGKVVATTTAVCFGQDLAWIGMVLTDPDHRRRGYARQLMDRALEFLEARRVRWLKLDATDMGAPLYRALGFEDESAIERWHVVTPPTSRAENPGPFVMDAALDLAAFGADRSRMLTNLAQGEAVGLNGGGYAMARPGANAVSFGPCVAQSADAARTALEWFFGAYSEQTAYWDILPDNRDAVLLAREFGFEPVRRLIRMVKPGVGPGPPLEFNNSLVYATAGFEYG